MRFSKGCVDSCNESFFESEEICDLYLFDCSCFESSCSIVFVRGAEQETPDDLSWRRNSRFNQNLSRECGLRLAPVCFRQGKVGTPYSQGRRSKRIPLHPPLETQKQKLGGSTWYSKFNQSLRTGSLPTGSLELVKTFGR